MRRVKYNILPKSFRKVMRMYDKGYSYAEIAEATGKNKSTIGQYIYDSIEKMKKFDYTSRKYEELLDDKAQLINLGFNFKKSPKEIKVFRYWKVLGLLDDEIKRMLGIKQRQLSIYKRRIRGRVNFEVFERNDADYNVWKRHTNYSAYDLDLTFDEEGDIIIEVE